MSIFDRLKARFGKKETKKESVKKTTTPVSAPPQTNANAGEDDRQTAPKEKRSVLSAQIVNQLMDDALAAGLITSLDTHRYVKA